MSEYKPSLEELLVTARRTAGQDPSAAVSPLLLDICGAVDRLLADQEEMRKEAFRDGIRGAAKVIKNRQHTPGSALSDLISEQGGHSDMFANEAAKIANTTPVRVEELRKLRQKINTAIDGNDDIDDELKRIYYSVMMERSPSSADVLPPGSPSRSLDVATFLVERMLRDGWWTLGNSGVNAPESPVAKVGRYSGQDCKPQTAATAVLTLLSALVLTLIESTKGK